MSPREQGTIGGRGPGTLEIECEAVVSAEDELVGGRVKISEEELGALQSLIQGHCGVVYGLDSGFLFERRLGPRLAALGLTSFSAYVDLLRRSGEGPQELALAVEAITTHETYFFREQFSSTRSARRCCRSWRVAARGACA